MGIFAFSGIVNIGYIFFIYFQQWCDNIYCTTKIDTYKVIDYLSKTYGNDELDNMCLKYEENYEN